MHATKLSKFAARFTRVFLFAPCICLVLTSCAQGFSSSDSLEAHIDGHSPSLGNPEAPVTIVQFADFGCRHCKQEAETMRSILVEYPQEVRLVFKHFIVGASPTSESAARASLAAMVQGKFWQMHDLLLIGQDKQSPERYLLYAKELGMDPVQFMNDQMHPQLETLLDKDKAYGRRLGVRSVPTIFVNGEPVRGARSFPEIEAIVNRHLSRLDRDTNIGGKSNAIN